MNRMPNPLQMQSRHLMIAVAASSMILGACRYRETAPQPRKATPCVGRTVPVKSAWISPEDAVERYITDATFYEELKNLTCDDWVTFLDFDFDGVLEAVVAGIGGSAQCRWASMYTIGHEDGNVKALSYDNGFAEGDMMGYTWGRSVCLLQDKRTGDYCYLVNGFVRDSSLYNFLEDNIGVTMFFNSAVHVKELGSHLQEKNSAEDKYQETFTFMGRTMSEDAYKVELDRYLSNFRDLHLKVGICEIRDQELCLDITGKDPVSLKGFTKDNLKTALLECYKAFSYDGHKN